MKYKTDFTKIIKKKNYIEFKLLKQKKWHARLYK